MTEKQMRTLAQMAAAAAKCEDSDAWACKACGCRDWRVADSRMVGNARKRQRYCRHCGQPMTTLEVPAQDE